jgi:hypothetical protein
MPTQRLSVARIGGAAGEAIWSQMRQWAAVEQEHEGEIVIPQADDLAIAIKQHDSNPPTLYFAEWIDLYSSGNRFTEIFTDMIGEDPLFASGVRHEILCPASLEDNRRSRGHRNSKRRQWPEERWYASRLAEAATAWLEIVPEAVVIVVREPLGPLYTDDEVIESLNLAPWWDGKSRQ